MSRRRIQSNLEHEVFANKRLDPFAEICDSPEGLFLQENLFFQMEKSVSGTLTFPMTGSSPRIPKTVRLREPRVAPPRSLGLLSFSSMISRMRPVLFGGWLLPACCAFFFHQAPRGILVEKAGNQRLVRQPPLRAPAFESPPGLLPIFGY